MNNLYNCTMDELISGLYIIKNNLVADIVLFNAHKGKYNMAFADAFAAAIKAADDAPDENQRRAENELLRNKLVRYFKADDASMERAPMEKMLGNLRSYIRSAYTNPEDRKVRLAEAGFDDYEKVMDYNWEVVRNVMNSGKEFLAAHEADLLDGGNNMPATFKAEFDTLADAVIADVDAYLAGRVLLPTMTQEKVRLNNIAYEMGMDILKDAQEIFKKNPAKRKLYTWLDILDVVTPPGGAGLRGTVKESGTNYPIVGASIEMQTVGGTPVMFETDADGKYYSGNLPVGVYSFKLNKTGYVAIETEVEIKVGTTSYKHWLMDVGGGTEYETEGNLVMGAIGNIDIEGLNDPDADVVLEAMDAPMNFFASNSPMGGAMGGVITVAMGVPVELKASVLISTIGLSAANSFFNVQNIGVANGSWKVRVSVG